jgi:hypothetical protein
MGRRIEIKALGHDQSIFCLANPLTACMYPFGRDGSRRGDTHSLESDHVGSSVGKTRRHFGVWDDIMYCTILHFSKLVVPIYCSAQYRLFIHQSR